MSERNQYISLVQSRTINIWIIGKITRGSIEKCFIPWTQTVNVSVDFLQFNIELLRVNFTTFKFKQKLCQFFSVALFTKAIFEIWRIFPSKMSFQIFNCFIVVFRQLFFHFNRHKITPNLFYNSTTDGV